jgi:hypothetical protein
MPSGTLLSKNRSLVDLFKSWLVSSTSTVGVVAHSQGVNYSLVCCTLGWIDYLLLHAEEFSIEKNGLSYITSDEMKGIFIAVTSDRLRQEAIYDWSNRVVNFLRIKIALADKSELECVLKQIPELSSVEDDGALTNASPMAGEELTLARAWLHKNQFYRIGKPHSSVNYRYSLDSRKLASILLKNTLRGVEGTKSPLLYLNAGPLPTRLREYPMIPTSEKGQSKSCTSDSCDIYRLSAIGLKALKYEKGITDFMPSDAVMEQIENLRGDRIDGRYRTLPAPVVFTSIRQAIEFHLRFSQPLTSSFASLVAASNQAKCEIEGLPAKVFLRALHPQLRKAGVRQWTDQRNRSTNGRYLPVASNSDYFVNLRRNVFLLDLVQVYFGAVQILVGIVMARRGGELLQLIADRSLDKSKRYLVFENEKSSRNLGGLRQKEARPIPGIASEMIEEIQKFQQVLVEHGFMHSYSYLFSQIGRKQPTAVRKLSHHEYNQAIDKFCDYFELPVENGRRYYLRQHQLRRFFAILFFWSHSFGGLETLRWFLGHADASHVYRYVTEVTPGAILRGVQAEYALSHIEECNELADLLMSEFGTSEFHLLDKVELEQHIERLIAEGVVKVEPHFFKSNDGEDYKIIVVVRGSL